ncbi:MAG: hypothetical protein NTY19_32300 [Planctomycetota bacterium]|nr:hypothetical protein [Planctomycetota bacterium]
MRVGLVLLAVLVAVSVATVQAGDGTRHTWRDDFSSRAAGSDGAPAWDPQAAGWEVHDGAYVGDSGLSVWQAVPLGAAITFACDVTVLEQLRGDWLTAGIALGTDEDNYWALNLVAAPESLKRRHSAELHESLSGQWLAETLPESRLAHRPSQGGQPDWQVNRTYRFEIQLGLEEVVGKVSEGGRDLATFGVRLAAPVPAVRAGRPMLRVNGLRVRFSNATVTVERTAPEPAAAKPSFPAWVSRGGQPIVKGSGFFRTVLIEEGRELTAVEASESAAHTSARWWLVDPEGKPFFDVGTDHVSYRGHWCEKLGYSPYQRNVAAKFGSEDAWAKSAIERLTAWGFNTLPAGHSPSLRHRGLAHLLFASFGASFARREWICEPIHWTGFPDVFSPRWESHCHVLARKLGKEGRGDPWCLGTFLDNELEWYGKHGHLVDEVFQLGPRQPAKQALYDWLLKHYGSLGEVNRRLGTQHADEQAFLAARSLPPPSALLDEVRDGFLAEIAERYFGVAAKALREVDPEHLVLGCRFAGRAPKPALAAAGKYNDVFTFNTYPRVDFESVWRADGVGGVVEGVPRELSDMYRVVRRPMIITEWSFPALDSGLPCQHGAGMRVDTQVQKAACYRIFANAMADLPFLAGYHYFMWADEPAPGISSTFPEDSNYGLVNEQDEPYEVLVKTAAEVNRDAAARHARSLWGGDLRLRAVGDAVELVNAATQPARGLLRIVTSGQSRIEEVELPPQGTQRVVVGTAAAWCAELQQGDGTKVRCLGGQPVGSLEVANVSATAVEGVPVVLDGPPVVAALIPRLEPGQTHTLTKPTAPLAEADQLELKAAGTTWSLRRRDGSLFDAIQAGDLPLGRLVFAAHQRLEGRDAWTEASRVVSVRAQEQADAWIIEAVVERAGAEDGAPAQFRAGLRAAVFKQGGLALVKPLWLENTDSRPWQFVEAFWFCRSAIGGSTADDDVGGPGVPNYYRAAQFCTDSKLGGCFGALGQYSGWEASFWKDSGGQIHPDTRWRVEVKLQPGDRWTADGVSYLWIFALRNANGWHAVAERHRQAEAWLTAGKEK